MAEPLAEEGHNGEDALGGHETILLVDDEEALRQFGARILEGKVTRYRPPPAASRPWRYTRTRPRMDLVVMDLGMPGMGGKKALKAHLEFNPRAKVIIVSGYSANGRSRSCWGRGRRASWPSLSGGWNCSPRSVACWTTPSPRCGRAGGLYYYKDTGAPGRAAAPAGRCVFLRLAAHREVQAVMLKLASRIAVALAMALFWLSAPAQAAPSQSYKNDKLGFSWVARVAPPEQPPPEP